MSNEIFPTLAGLDWGTEKVPQFDTHIPKSVSGFEVRVSRRAYPTYAIRMKFNFLRNMAAAQELRALVGLFLRHRGAGDSFLLLDPDDYRATAQVFGAGNGTARTFDLAAAWGGFVQPARNIKTITSVTVNGAGAAYVLGGDGRITFTTAPAAGAVLAWTGEYYFRCRFAEDTLTPREMMRGIWELGKCDLVGALGAQIG